MTNEGIQYVATVASLGCAALGLMSLACRSYGKRRDRANEPPAARLCMKCTHRRLAFERAPNDNTPCAMVPQTSLREAREICGGWFWEARK